MKSCPVCSQKQYEEFFEIRDVPVHCNLLWSNREEAMLCSKSDIRLAYCHHCTHIFNLSFDPLKMDYTLQYNNTLFGSQQFQAYARSLTHRLIKRYNLDKKHIIEIGCGTGDFLIMLCEKGNNTGTGFDPNIDRIQYSQQIKFVKDVYSGRYAKHADLLCSRHVLEHVADPVLFINSLHSAIGPDTIVYFEVPNVLYTIKSLGIWDIIYEHCLYFSTGSLGYLFASCGFNIKELIETFGSQYIGIEAKRGSSEYKPPGIFEFVKAFPDRYNQKIDFWKREVQQNRHGVVWGAGSKGVTFLNIVGQDMRYIVDVNPDKQGKYVAGTGQEIVSPEFLRGYKPEAVILMNPLYEKEVQAKLKSLGVITKVLCA